MVQMVDSRQQKLNPMEIASIAVQNTGSQYPLQTALMAIATEMSQPQTKVQQFGNTLFILHLSEKGGMFKALNADVAQNFLQNSIQFIQWVKQMGVPVLVADFNDDNILRLIRIIAANPPFPDMGVKIQKHTKGYRAIINMGGAQ